MKAKDVLKLLKISRQTLCNYVKRGLDAPFGNQMRKERKNYENGHANLK
jgi:predicted site-specific integrase-resolvase